MKTIIETQGQAAITIGHVTVMAPVPVKIEASNARASKLVKLSHVGGQRGITRLVCAQEMSDITGATIISANRVIKPQKRANIPLAPRKNTKNVEPGNES